MSDIESAELKRSTTNAGTGPPSTTTPANLESKPASNSITNNLTIINNDDSNVSPGRHGTIFSFITAIVGIIVSIICYKYAPDDINTSAFTNHCSDDEYQDSCKSNSAVLRISLALTLIFGLQILGTILFTKFYDILWILKFLLFCGLVIIFYNISNNIFGTLGYAWFARITGFFFLILQQIILIDLAYTWNEKWIEYSQEKDIDTEVIFKGNIWLIGIVLFSIAFYALAFACIGIMFWQFNNSCVDSMVILSLTIILPVIASVIQLFFSDQGSILTSAIMTLYSVYVCYSAISLNPSDSCNPTLDSKYQTLSSVIGLVLTVISLIWTTYGAVKKIPQVTDKTTGDTFDLTNIATGGKESARKTVGTTTNTTTIDSTSKNPYDNTLLKQLFIQVSVVFLCVSGYYAMVLTNWSTEQTTTSVSNPRAGTAAMWIQATGSWIAITLYLWTLIAPKILTDREF